MMSFNPAGRRVQQPATPQSRLPQVAQTVWHCDVQVELGELKPQTQYIEIERQ